MNDPFLLTHIRLIDGVHFSGEPGALLLSAGRVEAIFRAPEIPAMDIPAEDGGGRFCSPAWIDVHGHSDMAVLCAPGCESKCSGGIGIEIAGNCGLSAFPIRECNRANLERLYGSYGVPLTWDSAAGYFAALRKSRPRMCLYSLAGHNTLRSAVLGYEKRRALPEDLRVMAKLLARQMEEGALGLSSGLLYVPGRFAEPEELVFLLQTVRNYDGIYTTHLRSEGDRLNEAIAEAIAAVQQSGLNRLHISHFKTSGAANFGKLEAAFRQLEQAEKEGVSVTFDRYPYTSSMTQLSVAAGAAFLDLPDSVITERLKEPSFRERMKRALGEKPDAYWENTVLVGLPAGMPESWKGRCVAELCQVHRTTPEELVLSILSQDSPCATAAFHTMSEENMQRILQDKRCFCGTDEIARKEDGSMGSIHPRGSGGAARFFRLIAAQSGWNEAMARNAAAAERFHLACGRFQVGMEAQFTLFGEDLHETSDFRHPFARSSGVELRIF